ncbi:MAG: M28 family peptidase [Planctomycetota bacterium]|nr:M28 family peptidase [Planctomycetota bacterium]
MNHPTTCRLFLSASVLLSIGITANLSGSITLPSIQDEDRIRAAMNEAPEEERIFNDHITVLSSPWMGGSLPGTPGMEYARDYVIYWYKQAGLEPGMVDADTGERSWKQPFRLGAATEFSGQEFVVDGKNGEVVFELGEDFELTSLGSDGRVEGDMVFIGYSIDDGNDGYQSFEEETDLTGKIAVMLRFEPMNEDGDSLWDERRWSRKSTFASKFNAVKKRNPAAVILINPPGANDPRAGTLMKGTSNVIEGVPVFMLTPDAGEKLVAACDPEGRSLLELRKLADAGMTIVPFGGSVAAGGVIEETPSYAENVLGVLPGRGELKDEFVIIGGHLDHLGMGEFGSRRGSGNLHPGADDNASGAAALMMLGESLRKAYEEIPEDQPLRSIMFAAFDAEESGLNGSRFYADNPPHEIDDVALMINFDMIGRVNEGGLSVTGVDTGDGMREWAQPFLDDSGLKIVLAEGMRGGGSDHASFYRKNIPILFAICADFHDDYHTPDDTADKIYRTSGVKTVQLFHELALDAAKRPEKFPFASPDTGDDSAQNPNGPTRSRALRVRLGIRSRQQPDGAGLEVVNVTEGSTADKGGLLEGDVIKKWDKNVLKTRAELVSYLAELKPDDEVQVIVDRDGEQKVVFLKMLAPE